MSHLTSVCCQINEVHGRPSSNSIWTTSNLGDVFVYDPSYLKAIQHQSETNLCQQEIDVSATETPYFNTLYNGMPIGSILEVTGCVYDDADQIRFDLQCHPVVFVKHKVEKHRRVMCHINPRLVQVFYNDMVKWNGLLRNRSMIEANVQSFIPNFNVWLIARVISQLFSQKPGTIVKIHQFDPI